MTDSDECSTRIGQLPVLLNKPTSREEIKTTRLVLICILSDMEMSKDFDLMLKAMYDRDRSAGGRFLVGVRTTGIYCLPSCTARKPKAENVSFYASELEARQAGLRACKRCRPDSFYQGHDPDLEAMLKVAADVRQDPACFKSVSDLAAALRRGPTKVYELFREHFQRSPAEFLTSARVSKACELLSSGKLSVSEVCFAVGFDSLAPFHVNIKRRTGLTPGELRSLSETNEFVIHLPAGYLVQPILDNHGRDGESVIERVVGRTLTRAIHFEGNAAALSLTFEEGKVHCRLRGKSSPPMMRSAHQVATRLLGFGCDPSAFERRMMANETLAPLVATRRGLRIPFTADVFESLCWSIIGQQINLPFAFKLRRRLTEICGIPVPGTDFYAHPTPEAIAKLDPSDLAGSQYSRSKADYLIGVSRLIAERKLDVETLVEKPPRQVEKALRSVRGLGPWSTHYIMMRGCGFADCVPLGDTGLTSALQRFFQLEERPDAKKTLELMIPFEPYRSLASFHLWKSLSGDASA